MTKDISKAGMRPLSPEEFMREETHERERAAKQQYWTQLQKARSLEWRENSMVAIANAFQSGNDA